MALSSPRAKAGFRMFGGIHGALATAGTYQGVNLVDEEDNLSVGVGHLLDDALQTLLEFALVFGTSHQCAHVERIELLVLQVSARRHVRYALPKPFNDSGFTRSWFTYKDRVVLGSA